MDKGELRRECFRIHSDYRGIVICPLSGEELRINDSWDLHEVFVKRNDVSRSNQHLIMVVENCMPLEHNAHIARGSTRTAMAECARVMFRKPGVTRIGKWYKALWDEHDLSVSRAQWYPTTTLPIPQLMYRIKVGAAIHGHSLPADDYWLNEDRVNYLAAMCSKHKGQRKRWAKGTLYSWKEYDSHELLGYMDDGHWALYMMDALGIEMEI